MPSKSDPYQLFWRYLLRLKNSQGAPRFAAKSAAGRLTEPPKMGATDLRWKASIKVYSTFYANGYLEGHEGAPPAATVTPFSTIVMKMSEILSNDDNFSLPVVQVTRSESSAP